MASFVLISHFCSIDIKSGLPKEAASHCIKDVWTMRGKRPHCSIMTFDQSQTKQPSWSSTTWQELCSWRRFLDNYHSIAHLAIFNVKNISLEGHSSTMVLRSLLQILKKTTLYVSSILSNGESVSTLLEFLSVSLQKEVHFWAFSNYSICQKCVGAHHKAKQVKR